MQAWQIWNQRNWVVYGRKFHDLGWLITQARELLEDFRTVQDQMGTDSARQQPCDTWQPPPQSVFKLNFDAAIFSGLNRSEFGAIIRNEEGEVMVAMAAKGPKYLAVWRLNYLLVGKRLSLQWMQVSQN